MSSFNNLAFTTTTNGELNISSQTITGVAIDPVAPSTVGLISEYALLISPHFSGIPTAPTADVSNNSTQIATTAYVQANRAQLQANIDLKANINSPVLTGVPQSTTPSTTDDSTKIATTAHVQSNRRELQSNIDLKANINSPVLTGIPKAPTAGRTVHNEQIATTEYVYNAITDLIDSAPDALNTLNEIASALNSNSANDQLTVNQLLNYITSADASFNAIDAKLILLDMSDNDLYSQVERIDASLNSLEADKTTLNADIVRIDASLNSLETLKADKSYVDSQNTSQNATIALKADKSYVDTQNTSLNTAISLKADKSYVDTQNTSQNTTISAKADKSYVDASLNNVVKITENQTITGRKQFYYNPTITNDNSGNEFILYGQIDMSDIYNPKYAGIYGNVAKGFAQYPNWNTCGMTISSNAVEFVSANYVGQCYAMIDNESGKYWTKDGFYISDGSYNADGDNNGIVRLNYQGLSYFSGTLNLTSTQDVHTVSNGNTNIESHGEVNIKSVSLSAFSSNIKLTSDIELVSPGGTISASAYENMTLASRQQLNIDSSANVVVNSITGTNITSNGNIQVKSNSNNVSLISYLGTTTLDASNIVINSSRGGINMTTFNNCDINMNNTGGNTSIISHQGNTILDASQNVFIGTNSQGVVMGDYTNQYFTSNTSAPGFLTIGKSKNSSFNFTDARYLSGTGTGLISGANTQPFSIVAADRIGCPEFNAWSDLRLKENINKIELTEAMNLVKNIDPVTFDWKDNKHQTSGYIAQDILKNGCPKHLVSIIPDNDLEETIDSDNFVSPAGAKFVVNYNGLIPYYHKVIKNLVERIEELEKKI